MKIKRIFPILFVLISLCGCASTANMKSKKTTASANSELLPVGSVVSTKKSGTLIITGVAQIDATNHLFDYIGCSYPQGCTGDNSYLFNRTDITDVKFEGYNTSKTQEYLDKAEQQLKDISGE